MTTATDPDLARFLRDARALEDIVPMRADPAIAARNVKAGATAVLAYEAHVAEHLRGVDLNELRSLPALAAHVVEAAKEVAGEEGAETAALCAEALSLASQLRVAALALVEGGVLTSREVSKVAKDRGPIDAGAACGALAALFEKHAEEIAGKTAVDEDSLARASELAAELRARQKVKAAAKKAGPLGISPVDLRDRLWTLLALRHERLWAVGAYIYGHAVDEHVPRLLATPRVVSRVSATKGEAAPMKASRKQKVNGEATDA